VSERPKERASKAREGQPSAGSNPAATASLTRPNAALAASCAPALLAVVSNVVSIGPDWSWIQDHRRQSRRLATLMIVRWCTPSNRRSVSTLWAVANPAVAPVIERAQQAAVKDTLTPTEQTLVHPLGRRGLSPGRRGRQLVGIVLPGPHARVGGRNRAASLHGGGRRPPGSRGVLRAGPEGRRRLPTHIPRSAGAGTHTGAPIPAQRRRRPPNPAASSTG
jgi:hypothetical protein